MAQRRSQLTSGWMRTADARLVYTVATFPGVRGLPIRLR